MDLKLPFGKEIICIPSPKFTPPGYSTEVKKQLSSSFGNSFFTWYFDHKDQLIWMGEKPLNKDPTRGKKKKKLKWRQFIYFPSPKILYSWN